MHQFDLQQDWSTIKNVFRRSRRAGLHYAFSTINQDGTPNVTPIGSLLLNSNKPGGFYFDVYNHMLGLNLERNPNVAILAVDSRKHYWISSALKGKFKTPPALRLIGSVDSPRPVTQSEKQIWLKEMTFIRRLGKKRFIKQLNTVRDIHFSRVDVMNIGSLTR